MYLTKKKYIHRLESNSERNNIHPNNKQKTEITNENIWKITCQVGLSKGVGAGKFLGVRTNFAQISTDLPEKYSKENDLQKSKLK